MPLTMAKRGETNYIKKVTGRDDMRQRLAELGFVVGECVTVVNEMDGSMILSIKGARVALGKSMAGRIII
ncbi:MAG: ferrous iron transport protein A [Christensenellaceae bacterium]|nr:ferrous iron transport protein A [Christensenellaceae bacterium]